MNFKNLFKLGTKVKTVNPLVVDVEFLGKKQPALLYMPYGMNFNPKDESLVGLLADQGNEASLLAIATDIANREELVDGEISFGIPDKTCRVKFFDNDKIGIYNSVISLLEVINGLIDEIVKIKTTGDPTVHVLDPASQAALNAWKLQVEALLNGS